MRQRRTENSTDGILDLHFKETKDKIKLDKGEKKTRIVKNKFRAWWKMEK